MTICVLVCVHDRWKFNVKLYPEQDGTYGIEFFRFTILLAVSTVRVILCDICMHLNNLNRSWNYHILTNTQNSCTTQLTYWKKIKKKNKNITFIIKLFRLQ